MNILYLNFLATKCSSITLEISETVIETNTLSKVSIDILLKHLELLLYYGLISSNSNYEGSSFRVLFLVTIDLL